MIKLIGDISGLIELENIQEVEEYINKRPNQNFDISGISEQEFAALKKKYDHLNSLVSKG